MAAAAVMTSEAPLPVVVPVSAFAVALGLLQAWKEQRRPHASLFLPGGSGVPTLDGAALRDVRVTKRGPLTVIAWQAQGQGWQYRIFGPDTLSPAQRRELTLAAGDWRVSRGRRSMAP